MLFKATDGVALAFGVGAQLGGDPLVGVLAGVFALEMLLQEGFVALTALLAQRCHVGGADRSFCLDAIGRRKQLLDGSVSRIEIQGDLISHVSCLSFGRKCSPAKPTVHFGTK
ncbi:Uncharacterised protein [Mycobacteroides abscessus subsp. abscessus]|nr:Uncharacterised protein [Mycobacteroides abscessus subsp. abscessus]SHY56660.1 Uncharacterised protein [Mycobacteroides abscessus subsp. abscessus]SKX46629.1 Uncharacterised protein [Mycobacteroides abscessus subsp. abscessus]